MVELVINRPGAASRTVRLQGGAYVIGRAEAADIQLDDPEVSRRHARLLVDGDEAVLEDLDTQNGTFVGGEQIRQRALEDGDTIELSPFTLTIRLGVHVPQPRKVWLEIVDGPGTGTRFDLHGEVMGIGRAEDQPIRLPDQSASRAHASVVQRGETWFLRDSQSANGVTLNGRRVVEMELQAGDVVGVGNTKLKLFIQEPPPPPAPRPAKKPGRAPPPPPAKPAQPTDWSVVALVGIVTVAVLIAAVLSVNA
jgi:pSer/pThr/pTyr-binding forkhead associated (FHA) protein